MVEETPVNSALDPLQGLRERKKRQTRQLISDTATAMFLERGFDEVKVTDIADEVGMSEKTIYNYFPTKEALMLDREEAMADAIRHNLGVGAKRQSPIDGALDVLDHDLKQLHEFWSDPDSTDGFAMIRAFHKMVLATPSLRAAFLDMTNRLVAVAADAIAERAGVDPANPEPQIAATAIIGLWRVQLTSISTYADGTYTPDEVLTNVTNEVRRAARLIESGLWSFSAAMPGDSRAQVKDAADAARRAGKQVSIALNQAHKAWRKAHIEGADPSTRREEGQRFRRQQHEHARELRDEMRDRSMRMRDLAKEQKRRRRD